MFQLIYAYKEGIIYNCSFSFHTEPTEFFKSFIYSRIHSLNYMNIAIVAKGSLRYLTYILNMYIKKE